MILFIALLMSGSLIFFVLEPIFKKNEAAVTSFFKGNKNLDELIKQKNELLQELKDIEFEFRMGKLSERDYEELKNDYENQAIKVLQRLDHKEGGNGKSKQDDIELEIEIHKKKRNRHKTDDINFCSNCGSKIQPHAKFCSGCGKKLK